MDSGTTHTLIHQISNKLNKLTPKVRILDNDIFENPRYGLAGKYTGSKYGGHYCHIAHSKELIKLARRLNHML